MFFGKKKKNKADRPMWVPAAEGVETTASRQLIENRLSFLETKRTALVMAQKGRESSPTILLGSTGKYLLIDAPADWKLRNLAVRIQFKDNDHLDCYFDTRIVYAKDEIIYAKIPGHLCRLQRRAHFRVEVPGGSEAVYAGPSAGGGRLIVRNVSAGGMLCGSSRPLACGTVLKDIDLLLNLASSEDGWKTSRITIPQGLVVRTFDDRDSRQYCCGIAFACGGSEEGSLTAFIRQRELELTKTGVSA
jgi:c-di-GMP-binding flagellar brake protein YcgR